MYYRARYYDSSIGRFLSRDPSPGKLKLPLSVVNGYTYGLNDPLNIVDPSGKFGLLSWLGLGFILALGGGAVVLQAINTIGLTALAVAAGIFSGAAATALGVVIIVTVIVIAAFTNHSDDPKKDPSPSPSPSPKKTDNPGDPYDFGGPVTVTNPFPG